MKKNNISLYFLAVSFMSFVAIFFLITTKSYENLTSSINTVQSNSIGKTIDLDLKLDVINMIESREK